MLRGRRPTTAMASTLSPAFAARRTAPTHLVLSERQAAMLLSHSHRFIFIHVYKTGGVSVRAALEPYADLPWWPLGQRIRLRLPVSRRPPALGWHARAVDVRAVLPAFVYESYFKFAFVRNPWDWQVSLYYSPFTRTRIALAVADRAPAIGSAWMRIADDPAAGASDCTLFSEGEPNHARSMSHTRKALLCCRLCAGLHGGHWPAAGCPRRCAEYPAFSRRSHRCAD
jgi:hypothetical protein